MRIGGVTIRCSNMVSDGNCKLARGDRFIVCGPRAWGDRNMRPGDVLVLSPADYRRYRQTAAETVEASS